MESLQGLPSFNGDNFSRYNYQPHRVNSSRPTPYLSVVSPESRQHCLPIVSKREHYVINFLERQWDKRQRERAAAKAKRNVHSAAAAATPEDSHPPSTCLSESVSLDRTNFEPPASKEPSTESAASAAVIGSSSSNGCDDEGPAPKVTRRSRHEDGQGSRFPR